MIIFCIIFLVIAYLLYKFFRPQENLNHGINFEINNMMYIVVPCYNFEKYINKCLISIQKQNYRKYKCIVVNDGATDKTGEIIDKYCKTDERFEHLKFLENRGPAFGKYIGFKRVEELCNPNDICIVIDGDDYLLIKSALSHINNVYNTTKCWFTYGSCKGLYCSSGNIELINNNNYRKNKWVYAHPRTFKTYLLKNFTKEDFLYKDGSWLKKGTDINFVFKCVEFAGLERTHYISKQLYKYRTHSNNTTYRNSKQSKEDHKNYAYSKKPIKEYIEPIHVLLYVINQHNLQIK